MTTIKPSKADLIATLAAAGIATEAQLRRKTVADLEAMVRTAGKPTAVQHLLAVAAMLGLTLGEAVERRAYTRAPATDASGRTYSLYRNAANVTVVPKGMTSADLSVCLADLQALSGATVSSNGKELLIKDARPLTDEEA